MIASRSTVADFSGNWNIPFSTSGLESGDYNIRARAEISGERSIFGRILSFKVGATGCAASDFNSDARVDLIDFNILMFNWGTTNARGDINRDGRVDLIDFSILMFCWT